ncbi:MAG: hypothetical protein ABL909_03580 [Sphingopyxis sp.]
MVKHLKEIATSTVTGFSVFAHVTHATAEVSATIRQMEQIFGQALISASNSLSPMLNIAKLAFSLSLNHPITGIAKQKGSGSYDKATGTFYAVAAIQYADWTSTAWADRVSAYADAMSRGALAIHKTRISEEERAIILKLIGRASAIATDNCPEIIWPVRPIFLMFEGLSATPCQISYSGTAGMIKSGSRRIVMVPPEQAKNYSKQMCNPQTEPTGFKFYRKTANGLEYREAWSDGDNIVQHQGQCGSQGEHSTERVIGDEAQQVMLNLWRKDTKSAGFKTLPMSRHRTLVVSSRVDGFGSTDDLNRRHALEDFLNNELGWLGLGHCDGGSTGSGSMEAFCLVVDASLAIDCLSSILSSSKFNDFSVSLFK